MGHGDHVQLPGFSVLHPHHFGARRARRARSAEPAHHRALAPGVGGTKLHPRQPAREPLIVARPVKLTVQPRRTHLEGVPPAAELQRIQQRRKLTGDRLAVLKPDAFLAVQENPQHAALPPACAN